MSAAWDRPIPALDLVSAWHLLEAGPRQALRADLGCDDLANGHAAGRGPSSRRWVSSGTTLDSNVEMSRIGRRTLARIMDDHRS